MKFNNKNDGEKMDFDINNNESNLVDLNDKTLDEVFEAFHLEILKRDPLNIIVKFHQNGVFMIQEDEQLTYCDIRNHSCENINKLSNCIVNFCIKNDIEVILI